MKYRTEEFVRRTGFQRSNAYTIIIMSKGSIAFNIPMECDV